MAKITRRYVKKDGTVVIKTYDYSRKSSRGITLVSKKGKINRKNVDAFKDAIDARTDLTKAEKTTIKNDLEAYIYQRQQAKEKLTTTGFIGHRTKNAPERMFANAGMTSDEIAATYGLNANELRDPANWHGNVFTASNGDEYEFEFSYTGELLRKI